MVVRIFILLMALASPASYALDANNASKEGPKTYHLYDDVYLVSAIKFFYDKKQIVIKAVYPQLQSEFNHQTLDHFNEAIKQLVEEGKIYFKNKVDNTYALPRKHNKNNLYIDYASSMVANNKAHLLSIRLSFQGHIAGRGRPYHYHRVLNYDLDNDVVLNLADLFNPQAEYLDVFSQYTATKLMQRLNNYAMVRTGTQPSEKNFMNWNIKPDGIMFTFEDDQVAPNVYGAQMVVVPFSILRDMISPDSAIGSCAQGKNKKRCLRKQLMTGGFIDEAINSSHSRFNPGFSLS
ncbi:MAG: DUF3298 domain-containing protein [Gammaproteobacteria bacterium]|nr:DUF3298 domain-containing protein [Gammaproteobacteria bacterium]